MAQVDDSNHKNPIKTIAYCQQLDSVICLEQNSQHLRFYTPECQDKKFTLAPESESGKIFIIHFHTVDNYIAAVTSDRQLIFWDATTFKVIKQFKQEVLQTGIWVIKNGIIYFKKINYNFVDYIFLIMNYGQQLDLITILGDGVFLGMKRIQKDKLQNFQMHIQNKQLILLN